MRNRRVTNNKYRQDSLGARVELTILQLKRISIDSPRFQHSEGVNAFGFRMCVRKGSAALICSRQSDRMCPSHETIGVRADRGEAASNLSTRPQSL